MRIRPLSLAAGAVAIALVATACGSGDSGDSAAETPAAAPVDHPIAVTYDGGIALLDGETLAVGHTVDLPGFNRINPAGDEDHIVVSTGETFKILNAATGEWSGTEFTAPKPGHVVRHAGKTVLFADGTGEVTTFVSDDLAQGTPETETYTTPDAHHGVAIELEDGRLVVSLGTEEERTGMVVLDAERREIARSEECPGVHGEATAQDEAVVIGCENGALIYREGAITKVTSPTPYGRIGNQAGHDESPIVLGDYKQDEDAELERPQQVSLIDTTNGSLRLVDLGTSYTFRSLGRGPDAEALVLGTDGKLHVIDPVAGTVTRRIDVIAPWQEPLEWQQPRPALFVREDEVYVSDPATSQVHRIDLAAGRIAASGTLPGVPNELSGTSHEH